MRLQMHKGARGAMRLQKKERREGSDAPTDE